MIKVEKSRIESLTSLRFFAAMYVMVFHLEPRWLNFGTSRFGEWISDVVHTGYVGVGFFFILSGFILAYNYGEEAGIKINKRSFWLARFSRVYPVFLLSLIFGFMPAFMALYRAEPNWHAGVKILGFSFLNLTLLNGWYPPASILNYPGWSLSAEAFFYLIFPWVAPQVWNIHRKKLVLFMLVVAAFSILIPCLSFVIMPELNALQGAFADTPNSFQAFMLDVLGSNPVIRCTEFILGIAAGRYFLLRPKTAERGYGWAVGLSAIVVVITVSFCQHIPALLLRNGLLDLPFLAIIYFTAKDKKIWSEILNFSPLILLGEASYALYILHVPFRDLTLAFIRRSALAAAIPGPVWFCIFLGGIIPLCILVTLKVEEPCRLWLKQRFKSQPKIPPSILVETGAA